MSEDEINELLPTRQLKGYTSTTITDREQLKEILKTVAEQGYAIDDEEMDLGVRCVAAPIRDYTRRIVGAISVSGPTMRLSNERIEKEMIPLVQGAAEELSARLGYHK
jgi:DNA-binding IclR family transcriptional regulator